jgi:hypothetical protein
MYAISIILFHSPPLSDDGERESISISDRERDKEKLMEKFTETRFYGNALLPIYPHFLG